MIPETKARLISIGTVQLPKPKSRDPVSTSGPGAGEPSPDQPDLDTYDQQLMTAVVPKLSRLAREDGGRQKINQYTRYITIGIATGGVQGLFATTVGSPYALASSWFKIISIVILAVIAFISFGLVIAPIFVMNPGVLGWSQFQ